MPAISIITAAYNAASTLADCLESVAGQGVDAEHFLIDGGSGDGTPAVVERYRRSLAYVVSEPDRG
ncbi:MAG: glycosyltransferase, partial [Gammaproteobacteria bacterium]